jgi:glucosamine-6-phosphate deaminase
MQSLSSTQTALPPNQLRAASKVKLTILSTDQIHAHFARSIANEIKTNNQSGQPTRLILPVGPVKHYPLLVEICNQERISWQTVYSFNMDEYCDWQGRAIPIDHPLSFEGFMRRVVFDQLDPELRIPEENIHFPDPMNLDTISEKIVAVGGIDICYGGVGYHGHVAFNEPPVSRWYSLPSEEMRASLTRVVNLAPETIVMNSVRNTGGNTTNFPPKGVTLGMRDILAAKRIRLYCDGGEWQRYVFRIACLGDTDADYPVTLLQDHQDYEIFASQDTATPPISALGI